METILSAWFYGYNDGMNSLKDTHPVVVGYILWIFGFPGSHRFYFGKPITGTIWFFTGGLLLIGWIIDLFLIPGMARRADLHYQAGSIDNTLAWVFLTFLGIFGIHRFYMDKWTTGIIYLLTGGLLGIGLLYDLWTLNGQVSCQRDESPRVVGRKMTAILQLGAGLLMYRIEGGAILRGP